MAWVYDGRGAGRPVKAVACTCLAAYCNRKHIDGRQVMSLIRQHSDLTEPIAALPEGMSLGLAVEEVQTFLALVNGVIQVSLSTTCGEEDELAWRFLSRVIERVGTMQEGVLDA